MESTTQSSITGVTKYLPLAEKMLLLGLAVGTLLMLLAVDSSVVKVSLL